MRGDAPLLAASAGGLGALVVTLLARGRVSPVVTETLGLALRLAPTAAVGTFALLLGVPPWGLAAAAKVPAAAALALSAAAAVSLLLACGTVAGAEAGWRRPALWGAGVALAAAAPAATALLLRLLAPPVRPWAALLPLSLALLAWAPPYLLEARRVLRELGEEVALGILPAADPAILARPWRRAREKRFGRPDERREYVRSALLLAAARAQQRRRSGEAERLRQLEILAFRTRVRRNVDVHAEQAAERESPGR